LQCNSVPVRNIAGQRGDDIISGGDGNDTLHGDVVEAFGVPASGEDSVSGGIGDDFLDGGGGPDTLAGGDGRDTFHFHNLGDGVDTVTDFAVGAGGDVLDVADLLFGFTNGVSDLDDFVQCEVTGGNTTVKVDADGAAGGAAFTDVCVLTGVTTTLTDLVAGGNIEPSGA